MFPTKFRRANHRSTTQAAVAELGADDDEGAAKEVTDFVEAHGRSEAVAVDLTGDEGTERKANPDISPLPSAAEGVGEVVRSDLTPRQEGVPNKDGGGAAGAVMSDEAEEERSEGNPDAGADGRPCFINIQTKTRSVVLSAGSRNSEFHRASEAEQEDAHWESNLVVANAEFLVDGQTVLVFVDLLVILAQPQSVEVVNNDTANMPIATTQTW